MEKDTFSEVTKTYQKKMADLFKRYEIKDVPKEKPVEEPKPVTPQNERTQPIEPVPVFEERWTVYSFTLPIKRTRRVAFGLASKEAAERFIKENLLKRNDNDELIQKHVTIGDEDYLVFYDVIRESVERKTEIEYYNEPDVTTVGNNHEDVLKAWVD